MKNLGFALALALAVASAALCACGGQAFTVATSSGSQSGSADATTADASDAASNHSGLDAREAGPDVSEREAAPEASVEAAVGGDAQWVPDAIEPPPAHCGTALACAPGVPPGWSGPLEIYAGAMPPSSCSANFEGPVYDGNTGVLTAGPAACDCQCQAAQGIQCSLVDVSFYGGFSCTAAAPCAQRTPTPGVCTRENVLGECDAGAASVRVPAPVAMGGTCMPSLTKTVPPATWGAATRACVSALGSATSDCPAGQVCTPLPGPPFQGSICIAQAGVLGCPTTGYNVRRTYYGGVADSRDCSSCTCGPVTGAACMASLEVFALSPMALPCTTSGSIKYAIPASCDPVQQPGDFRLVVTPSSGQCSPAQVAATGMAVASEPTTFCCLP